MLSSARLGQRAQHGLPPLPIWPMSAPLDPLGNSLRIQEPLDIGGTCVRAHALGPHALAGSGKVQSHKRSTSLPGMHVEHAQVLETTRIVEKPSRNLAGWPEGTVYPTTNHTLASNTEDVSTHESAESDKVKGVCTAAERKKSRGLPKVSTHASLAHQTCSTSIKFCAIQVACMLLEVRKGGKVDTVFPQRRYIEGLEIHYVNSTCCAWGSETQATPPFRQAPAYDAKPVPCACS